MTAENDFATSVNGWFAMRRLASFRNRRMLLRHSLGGSVRN
jgi:hypothetical protein